MTCRNFVPISSHTRYSLRATFAVSTTKEGVVFTEMTRELLDLTAEVKGEERSLFAMVIDGCSCCCCSCLWFCW
jgi:hypothetical protein